MNNHVHLIVHVTSKSDLARYMKQVKIDLDKSYNEYEICMSKKERKEHIWKKVKAPQTPDMFHRFINSIKTGKNDQPDFERGYLVQKYLDASLESGTTNKTVEVRRAWAYRSSRSIL